MKAAKSLKAGLERKLAAYAGAAAAAGVLSTVPAQATDVIVPLNLPISSTTTFEVDGSPFTMYTGWTVLTYHGRVQTSFGGVQIGGTLASDIMRTQSGIGAGLLPSGYKIGPSQRWGRGTVASSGQSIQIGKECIFGCSGYLGLKFDFSGDTHYGWLKFSLEAPACRGTAGSCNFGGDLESVGFDTVPDEVILAGEGTDIITPEPGCLGLLALGALGIGLTRRLRKAA